MNKKLIALALLAGSTFAGVANAADGNINFTGNITSAACTITPASEIQAVALGTVSSTGLGAVGDTSAPTKFEVVLTSCPAAANSAVVKFDGRSNADNSSLLAITDGTGAASGVGIGLYEGDGSTQIPVGAESASKTLSTTADTTFTFYAKYMATAAVTEGSANAVSDFTVIYN